MTQKRKRNKRWVSRLLILVLFVAAGVVLYLVWDTYFNDNRLRDGRLYEQTTKEDRGIDEEKIEEDRIEASENDEKRVVQYEGDYPNLKEELSGSVTYAGRIDDRIVIRVNIDQYLNEGKCDLHLVSDGIEEYNDTVGIIGSASTATCEGFDVPIAGMGSGRYDIIINMSSGDKKGVIRGEVNI